MTERHGRRVVVEPLEARLLYSADPITAVAGPLGAASLSAPASGPDSFAPQVQVAAVSQAAEHSALQSGPVLVVVDARAVDLWAGFRDQAQPMPADAPLRAIVIAAGDDGLAAISQALADSPEAVSHIEIVGYSGDAGIEIGSTRLDAATVRARAGELAQWSDELAANAGLRITHAQSASPDARLAERALAQSITQLTGARTEIVDPLSLAAAPVTEPVAQVAVREVVIIDGRIDDPLGLAAEVMRDRANAQGVEVHVLDPAQDGLAQVSRILAAHENLDAVHILAHGASGLIELGGTRLDATNLLQYRESLGGWGGALAADGDLLLYGCSVGEGDEGQRFALQLASLTGADVALSTDLTGSATLGGDWVLESAVGNIEAQGLFARDEPAWAGLLAITDNGTVSSTQSSNATSLTFAHTVAAGTDRMLIVSVAIDGLGASVTGVTYGGVALTQIGRGTGNHAVELWGLVAPTVGTANVVVNLAGSTAVAAGAATFNGVDQSTPTSGFASATGSGTTSSVNVASATGELVVDVQYWDNNPGGGGIGAGQTLSWSASNVMMFGRSTTEAGAATVTMSGTVGSAVQWEIAGVSLAPSASNTPPVLNLPAAQSTPEDTNLVFSSGNGNLISITDPDASGATTEVTLAVTNGTLSLSGTTGLTLFSGDGSADASMGFRGTLANVNAALNGLFFTPTANYSGGATLTLSTTDSQLASLNIDVGLQARYTFEGNANDVAPGTAQNGGLVNGAIVTTDGTRGQVLSLDGANDYVDLSAHTASFAGFTQGTISGWVRATGTLETLFSVSDTADTGSYASLFLGSSGYLTYEVVENGVTQLAVYRSSAAINDGNWHHVALTVGAAGNSLYVDGALATSGQLTYDTGNATTQRFFSSVSSLDAMALGRTQDSAGGKWFMQGDLDDVRVYDRVLTSTEIVTLANDLAMVDTGSVALTVNAANDAPVVAAASLALSEGQTVTLAPANFTVTDPDNASFTYSLSAITGGYFQLSSAPGTPIASFTSAQLAAGIVQFVDDGNEVAPSFSVTASDGAASSNTLAATVSYTPVNDAPVLAAASLTLSEGQTVTLAPANFTVTDPDNASFTYSLSAITGGYFQLSSAPGTPIASFTSAQLSGGLVQFVDDGNEVAPGFSITVNDGSANSNTLAASVTYTPANDTPVVAAATLTLNEGQTVTLAPANFTVTDPDSASFTYQVSSVLGGNFQLSSAPGSVITAFTTAQLAGGIVQFVDDGNEVAPSFTLGVSDGAATSSKLAATVNYTPVNDAPVAVNDSASTPIDTAVSGNVRSNDTDVDGGALSITQFQVSGDPTVYGAGSTANIAGVGSLTLLSNGNYTFTPTTGYNGAMPTATYTVSDGAGGSATGTLSINVGISASGWGITGTNSLTEGQNASYTLTLSQSMLPGQTASVDLSLTDISTAAGDHADFVAAVNAAIASRPDLSFDGTRLTYTGATAGSYSQSYNPTGAGGATSISATGTALNLGDDSTIVQSLGFNFQFFGVTYNSVLVDANGEVMFNTSVGSNFSNVDMSAGNVLSGSPAIMAFWDDLNSAAGGNVYTRTSGAVGSRQFIVEWSNVPYFGSGSADGGTIQLVLNEGSNSIVFRYLDVDFGPDASHDNGASATIGIQNGTNTGFQFSFDSASVVSGSAVTYTPQAVMMAPLAITLGTVDDATVELAETYRINLSNSIGSSLTANFQITTTINDNDNLPPVANNDTLAVTEDTPASTNVLSNDTDPNGQALVVGAATIDTDGNGTQNALTIGVATGITDNAANPIGTITVNTSGLVSFTPAANYAGAVPTLTYTASDGFGGTDTGTLTIGPVSGVNDAPVVTAASLVISEGQTVTLAPANFSITDPDSVSFTYTVSAISGGFFELSSAPGTPITSFTSAQLAGSLVRFVDDGNESAPAFSVTVSDGALGSNTLAATITYSPVNDAPVVVAAAITLTEGQTVTLTPANFTISDPDNASFTYTASAITGGFFQLSSAPGTPITSFTSAQLAGGLVQFVDDGNEVAPSFSVTVNDGSSNSNALAASVTYSPVNDAPVVTATSLVLSEGQTVTLAPANVTVSDPDSAVFSYTVSAITGGFFQLSSAPGTPITSFTDAQLAGGLVQFVDDGNEVAPSFSIRANDGTANSVVVAASISYTPVNDSPVLAGASLTVSEGQTVTLSGANFSISDPDSAAFIYTVSSVAGGFFQLSTAAGVPITSFTTAQLAASQVQFVDDGNELTPSFDVTVSDGALSSAMVSASISFTPANDPPVLAAVGLTISEGQTVTLAPADLSVTDPDSASFTYTASAITGGFFQLSSAPGTPITSFTDAQLAGGLVQFVDDGNEVAPGFSLRANDGTSNSNTLAATIAYTPVNDAPVAAASLAISESQTVTLTAANFAITDPDSASFTFAVSAITGGYFQLASAPGTPITSFTTAQLTANQIQFVDDDNEVAPAFDVTVSDGALSSATVSAVVSYTPVNDAPVVTAASLTLNEGQTVTLAPADFSITDPDNASFTYTASAVTGGFFQLSSAPGTPVTSFTSAQLAGGLVQFVDDGNELAPSFSVRVNDGAANSNTLAATISYTPVNDAPVVTAASLTLNEGQTVTLSAADVTVSDPDSAVFSYTVSAVTGGFFQLTSAVGVPITTFSDAELASGLVQFVDDGNEVAPSFSIAAGDGAASSAALAATVSYTPVNDPPALAGATLTISEAQTVTLSGANFSISDPDSAVFTFSVSSVTGGYFQLSTAAGVPITSFTTAQLAASQVQFVDDGNELAPSFDVTVSDGALSSATVSAVVSYAPVNDAPTLAGLAGDALAYNEGDGAQVIEQGADTLVSDVDSADFAGGSLTVTIVAGGNAAEDVLGVRNQGVAAGQIGTSGATITYGGVAIGSFTGGNGGAPLTISLGANTDVAAATALIRNIDYTNTNTGNPATGARTVRFVLNDGDGGTSLAHDATVTVSGINDAPLLTSATLTLSEGGTVSLAAGDVAIVDPDSASFTYTVSGVAGGFFQLSGSPGAPIASFTSAQLSGGVVQFVDDGNEIAPAFDLTANDGLLNSNTLTASVTYTPVNDAPVLAATSVTVTEGLTLTLAPADITVNDPDSASFTYTLSGIAGGFFQLAGAPGTPITNFTTADLVSGLVQFVDDGNETAPAFALTANDGSLSSNVLPAAIGFVGVNDAPVITAPAAAAVLEDNTLILNAGLAISVADSDLGASNLQVSLSVSQGVLTLSGVTGLSFSTGDGSADATMQFTGSAAAVNAALDGLSYTPLADYNGADAVTIGISDLGNTGLGGALTASASVALSVGPVNDAPSLTLPLAQSVAEDGTLIFSPGLGNALNITDIDASSGNLRLQLSAGRGALSLSTVAGLTFSSGTGTGDALMIFDGTATAINTALAGLSYRPNADYNGADTLQLSLSDLGNSGIGGALSVNGSVALSVSAVNDAPVITLPAMQAATEDTPLVLSAARGNAIVLADIDAATAVIELTLSADRGSVSLSRLTGLALVSGTGLNDLQVTVRGTTANLNAALDGLSFNPEANFNGSTTLTVTVDDLGNTGSGGALTLTQSLVINVAPVNDAPLDLLRVPALLVTETAPAGTGAGQIVAVDLDDSSGFMFDLLDNAGHFRIDASTGAVTVVSAELPDFDVRSSYQISVRVTDPGGASIDRTFTIRAARREFVPPPPPASEVGVPTSSTVDSKSASERNGGIVANDSDVDSRNRRGLVLEPTDTRGRRSGASAFQFKSVGLDGRAGARPQSLVDGQGERSDELSLEIRDAKGELLSRRGFELRRLAGLLQFSAQRDSADPDNAFDSGRGLVRLPADLMQWTSREQSAQRFHVTVESIQMGGVAVSIGMVFYALRAGGLMAAMLTALPTWSGIDPLVILSREKGERVDDWGDAGATEFDQDEAAVRDIIAGDHEITGIDANTLTGR